MPQSSGLKSDVWGLLPHKAFEFVGSSWPVRAKEPGQSAVGEELACRLTARTIVGFVGCVANALDLVTAARARLLVFTVNCHLWPEGGDLFGEPDATAQLAQTNSLRYIPPEEIDPLR